MAAPYKFRRGGADREGCETDWIDMLAKSSLPKLMAWLLFYEMEQVKPGAKQRKEKRLELEKKLQKTSVVYRRRRKNELSEFLCTPRRLRMREFTDFPYPAAPDASSLPPLPLLPPTRSPASRSRPPATLMMPEMPSQSVSLQAKPYLLRRPGVIQEAFDSEAAIRFIRERGNYLDLKPLVSGENEALTASLYEDGYPLLLKRYFDGEEYIDNVRKRQLEMNRMESYKIRRAAMLVSRQRELQRQLAKIVPQEGDADFDLPFTTELLDDCFAPVSWPWFQDTMKELELKHLGGNIPPGGRQRQSPSASEA